jgi:hypothetical protein
VGDLFHSNVACWHETDMTGLVGDVRSRGGTTEVGFRRSDISKYGGTSVHPVGFLNGDGIFARSGTVTIATKAA